MYSKASLNKNLQCQKRILLKIVAFIRHSITDKQTMF